MAERIESKLPRGVRKHNRVVLAKARQTHDPKIIHESEGQVSDTRTAEAREWEATEKVLSQRVEGYPENFSPSAREAVKDFFSLRRRLDVAVLSNLSHENVQFQQRFTDEILDEAAPAFRVISQLQSRTQGR